MRRGLESHDAPGDTNVDLSILKNTVGYMVRIVQLQVFQAFYEEFRERGLTTGIYSALVAIDANPGIKQGTLGNAMVVKRSNMTKLINHMVLADLVERRISVADKRAMDLYLTAHGRRTLADVQHDALAHDRAVTANLSAQERRAFLNILNKLSTDLSRRGRAEF